MCELKYPWWPGLFETTFGTHYTDFKIPKIQNYIKELSKFLDHLCELSGPQNYSLNVSTMS